jgi:hypothetical protein
VTETRVEVLDDRDLLRGRREASAAVTAACALRMPWPQSVVSHVDEAENGFAVLSMIWRTCAGREVRRDRQHQADRARDQRRLRSSCPPPAAMPHAASRPSCRRCRAP